MSYFRYRYVLLFTIAFLFACPTVYAAPTSDGFVSMLTNPIFVSFLLAVGFIGIALEFVFPGLVIPGTIGIGALGIYFLGHYLIGSIGWDVPALFILGLFLFIIEIFIPNFGIMGILGFSFLVASFMMTVPSWQVGVLSLAIGIGLTILFLYILSRFVDLKIVWSRFVLKDEQSKKGYIPHQDRSQLLGKVGVTTTMLRPSGYARFEESLEDVVSEGKSIPANVNVKVVAIEGMRVVVRKVDEGNTN